MYRPEHEPSGVAVATVEQQHRPVVRHWVSDAVPSEVPRLRAAIVDFASQAELSDARLADVRLAVSEALTNAVLHAYPDDAWGSIEVQATTDPTSGSVTICVRDHGTGCQPRSNSPGLGMGLPLMATLASAIDITSPEARGTEVHLTFRPDPRA